MFISLYWIIVILLSGVGLYLFWEDIRNRSISPDDYYYHFGAFILTGFVILTFPAWLIVWLYVETFASDSEYIYEEVQAYARAFCMGVEYILESAEEILHNLNRK